MASCTASDPDATTSESALATPLRAQDLAILLPMDGDTVITAADAPQGAALLPEAWIDEVADILATTPVGDALYYENYYEDWRLVSLRVNPCAPLGTHPGHEPDALCWPQVRLVWQPIIPDLDVGWIRFDHYADDRAIHAIYDWRDGAASQAWALADEIRAELAAGAPSSSISGSRRAAFEAGRDAAVAAVTGELLDLRGNLPTSAYDDIGLRAETLHGGSQEAAFVGRLRAWLGARARPTALTELTAFSLPEGRIPALMDLWAFVAFEASGGVLTPRDIPVRSRETGEVLATLPGVQVVDTASEDPILVDALAGPAGPALTDQVIYAPADIARLGDEIADPDRTLIPNTSCASCHRLNDIRFDFHNLSHLEERGHTISPRVVADVARELAWLASQ